MGLRRSPTPDHTPTKPASDAPARLPIPAPHVNDPTCTTVPFRTFAQGTLRRRSTHRRRPLRRCSSMPCLATARYLPVTTATHVSNLYMHTHRAGDSGASGCNGFGLGGARRPACEAAWMLGRVGMPQTCGIARPRGQTPVHLPPPPSLLPRPRSPSVTTPGYYTRVYTIHIPGGMRWSLGETEAGLGVSRCTLHAHTA